MKSSDQIVTLLYKIEILSKLVENDRDGETKGS